MSSAKGLRASGFVIFRKVCNQIEYLLLQTSYGSHHWTPPKGHVDPGESDLETALRETEEETGLTKTDLCILADFNKTIQYVVRGKPKTAVYLLAELIKHNTPVKLSEEHQRFKWALLDEACELVEHQSLQEVLKVCSAFLHQYHT
ncbi:Bis(5'-nucleosyl)-tetraphosphatase [asymmetrical] [Cryptotermes secundus]|uniref:Bis(5'-nucleosyl)-tetraphosphatase [asymmetrical] n=1 Tax=Cryptotermes secundus TaxID=105785 RepID=A0A2J7QS17_9NEOP|nr:bis(5'-nucleosyl)-tetraphosphatase [asymmetrical] [Cryptotermes secundus]PNF31367.1 Bis(5'-nucleosyl)-tetraphosphatase [asymmetrical] [Cryptotermes secundus]